MIKDSDKELVKAVGLAARELGKFLLHSVREPIEYAQDQISMREYRSGAVRSSVLIPTISLWVGVESGLANRSIITGVAAGGLAWTMLGIEKRIRWSLDYRWLIA